MVIVIRDTFTIKSTIGELRVTDTTFKCYTLEDVARATGVKIQDNTAIPAGVYSCKLTYSPKFNRILPIIYNIPDYSVRGSGNEVFTGIRIHNGVNHVHTSGCLLVGYNKGADQVFGPAADDLVTLLTEKHGNEEFPFIILNHQSNQ